MAETQSFLFLYTIFLVTLRCLQRYKLRRLVIRQFRPSIQGSVMVINSLCFLLLIFVKLHLWYCNMLPINFEYFSDWLIFGGDVISVDNTVGGRVKLFQYWLGFNGCAEKDV